MISGLAILIIMACFLLPVNLINRIRVGNELRRTLHFIMESGGDFSGVEETEYRFEPDGRPDNVVDLLTRGSDVYLTPESRYQLRYFTVEISGDEQVVDVSLSHIAAVDEENAAQLARLAALRRTDSGFIHAGVVSYYYLRMEDGGKNEDTQTVIGFLDCTRELNSLFIFSYSSVAFALLLILVYMVIMVILSKRAIQPYLDNMESQREFITNASHELKTPLAIISANTEVIEMINGKNEWTDSILTQVKRGTTLINDLITLSRASEAEQVVLTDVDLSKIVLESAQSFRPVIEKDGKRLEVQVQEEVHVKAELKMLTELCNILVDNAAKYCDDQGMVGVVLKKKGRSGALLQVSNDYRSGEATDYSRFFRRFYRGDLSHNSKKSGYGIGLSMAQTITEKLKGGITVHWKDGRIVFSVTL